MTDGTRVTMSRTTAIAGGLILLLIGAAVSFLLVRGRDATEHARPAPPSAATGAGAASPAVPPEPPSPSGDAPLPDVDVTLTEEAVTRAGIEVAPVSTSGTADAVTIPGVIEADAYRRVAVTPLVAGRVTRVNAQLGQHVRRGAALALIYSPGLAEAQTRYLSMSAELEAAAQELKRTERLVEIGAASRQELERIRATHTTAATAVEGARAQLVLLGMTPSAIGRLTSARDISATTSVPAPIDGVITERQANLGLNVDTSTPLFTVVDLSSVWVQGDLYEKDFPNVRVGSAATVTTTAYPGLALRGRVAYIDPQLNEQTRTARVRVEVPNPRGELRLGMYAEMQIAGRGRAGGVAVAREAVQTIGNRQFVYVAKPGQRGRYIEREVRIGKTSGDVVEIAAGLNSGDAVVTKGSFFVRAERERLGLRQPGAAGGGMPHAMPTEQAGAKPAPLASDRGARQGGGQSTKPLQVTITEKGFEPERVAVARGAPARITFVRTTDNTCANEVLFPSLNIKRALPLNEPVVIEFTPEKSGEISFTCGMNMLRGSVVVQ
jgi:cobalt-zinc-cadmium efflux system membrane fusion protein